MLDIRTILLSHIVSNGICALVIAFLWVQNRRRFDGIQYWLVHFVMQFLSVLLLALRGVAPDFVSIIVGNALAVAGSAFLYAGLGRFLGRPGPQRHNVLLVIAFVGVHLHFTYVDPSLNARNINVSLGLAVIHLQSAWLLLRRADAEMRRATRVAGVLLLLSVLVSLVRVVLDWRAPAVQDLFHSGLHGALVIMSYQMLSIALTFSLYLVVNRRLFGELERDLAERTRLATTDMLTGLANRSHFMDRAAIELARRTRYGGELSLLMLDIDHFKRINDTWGHQTGDLALRRLGTLFREALRDIDIAGRIGGEEFAILLPQTGIRQASEVAERLRGKLAAMEIPVDEGHPLRLTISIGVACVAPEDADIDTVLKQADLALYEAKHRGRNQVRVSSGERAAGA